MKKRLLALFGAFILATGICACGNEMTDYKALRERINAETIKQNSEKINNKIEDAVEEVSTQVKEDVKEALGESGTAVVKALKDDIKQGDGILSSVDDIELTDISGKGSRYNFVYGDETFDVLYYTDNWKIKNSYKINNESDITIICQALINEHPVHGSDLVSYRTADDMAYEWIQHNLAYALLTEGTFKNKAKDVDLNPADQGKTFQEMYKARTGKDLTLEDIMNYLKKD